MRNTIMTIREFDERLYRQLEMCIDGNYIGAGAEVPTAMMLFGMRASLETAIVGRWCDCGDPSCQSFRIAGTTMSRDSVRIRFRVYGELSVICDSTGSLQHVEWLPDPPRAIPRRYENRNDVRYEVGICPFPE
ncbi:MAG TPA: hypothetical protein VGF18_05485 [Candidatus Tumulicola sp.]|jgi:hypothetical protein